MKVTLQEKSFSFAISVTRLHKLLVERKREFVISKQFLRSETAPGALIREAQNVGSKADFIHKLAIAQKECDEMVYWLELLAGSEYLETSEYMSIHNQANELLKMIKSAILTTRENMKRSQRE